MRSRPLSLLVDRRRSILFSVLVAVVSFVGGIASAQKSNTAFSAILNQQLAAINAKDAAKYAATYAENAVVLSQEAPLARGRAAIEKDSRRQMDEGATQIQFKPIESDESGDIGYSVYTGSLLDAKNVKRTFHGVTIFRRTANQWQAVVDASMNDSPAK